LKTVEIIHHVKIDFYFISVEIFKFEIFRSRFIFVEIFIEIVETNRDCRDKSRSSRQIETFKIYQEFLRFLDIIKTFFFKTFSRLQAQKSRQIEKSLSRTVITLTNSRSRSRKTVKICHKCHVSTDFSVSIETFRTFRMCRDKIEISQSRSRYLDRRD
jgi:hypothetical protein